jgi:tetratricopeptide (TPR) repeat protein
MSTYRQAIRVKPRFGPAYLELGHLLERAGRKSEADQNYRLALENRVYRPAELAALAQFCQGRGWFDHAAANFADAIKLSPFDATLRVSAGRCFVSQRKYADARKQFEEAVRLAPELGAARFLLGVELESRSPSWDSEPRPSSSFAWCWRAIPRTLWRSRIFGSLAARRTHKRQIDGNAPAGSGAVEYTALGGRHGE